MQDTDAEASLLINLDGDAPESRNKVRGIKTGRNAGIGRRGWADEERNLA